MVTVRWTLGKIIWDGPAAQGVALGCRVTPLRGRFVELYGFIKAGIIMRLALKEYQSEALRRLGEYCAAARERYDRGANRFEQVAGRGAS